IGARPKGPKVFTTKCGLGVRAAPAILAPRRLAEVAQVHECNQLNRWEILIGARPKGPKVFTTICGLGVRAAPAILAPRRLVFAFDPAQFERRDVGPIAVHPTC